MTDAEKKIKVMLLAHQIVSEFDAGTTCAANCPAFCMLAMRLAEKQFECDEIRKEMKAHETT
jgi:hypothetical protein